MGLVATHILNVASGAIDLAAEAIDDRVAALIVAGTGITVVYSDVAGTLTISTDAGGTAAWGGISGTLSSQTDLQSALNAKAALASPEFTGTPAAPTATGGTNTTQIATTAFVQTAVSGAGGTSAWGGISGTLSSQTDLQSALNAKAALASPTFTGTPAAPTATGGTNTTQIATTAFVQTAVSGASIVTSLNVELGSTVWQTHPSGAALVTAINAQIGSTVWQGGGSGTPAWGTIVGTLADQTDLNAALSGKAASSHTHTLSSITDIVVTSDKITFTQGLRPGLYDDLVTPPTGTIFRSVNDGHLYFCHDDASVHLLCDSGGYGGGVDWGDITGTLAFQADLQAELDAKQPLSTNLTVISSISTIGYELIVATASGMTAMATSAAVLQLLDDTSTSAMRSTLGLEIGTNVHAFNNNLNAIAGLATAVDMGVYFTGSGTAAMFTITAAARALMDDTSAAGMRSTLGLVIGSNVQAFDAELTAIAGLASAADKGIEFTGAGTAGTFDLTAAAKTILDDASTDAIITTLGGAAYTGTGGLVRLNNPTFSGVILADAGSVYAQNYGAPGQIRVRRAQGTQASPTAATTGIQLGIVGAQGYNGTAYSGWCSYISFNAAENIGSGLTGGYMQFYSVPIGTSTEVSRLWIGAAGNVGVGTFTAEPTTKLDINGDALRIRTSKTPATATAAGNAGDICWNGDSIFAATATNVWKRSPLIGFNAGISCAPVLATDRYYSGYGSQQLSTVAMTANVLTFVPIAMPSTFSATRIGVNVSTAVAGGARLGLYNDVNGVPSGSPLLDAGTVDIGTTGEKEITITQSLPTGVYWLAIVANAAATVTAENLGTTGISVPNLGSASGAGNSITHFTQSHTYAALPTVGTLTAATTKTPPRVWIRNYTAPPSPTFVASSVTGLYPAGIATGDIIVLHISDGSPTTLPTGFTNLGTQVASLYERACYKVASGSESGAPASAFAVECLVIRGGNVANIGFAFSATHTVAAANSLVAVLGWSDGDAGPGIEIVAPSGWTRRANTSPSSPGKAVLTLNSLRPAGSYTDAVSFAGSYGAGRMVVSIG